MVYDRILWCDLIMYPTFLSGIRLGCCCILSIDGSKFHIFKWVIYCRTEGVLI